ncbi:MAG: DsbA family protein [Acidiferrobacterales bacterium]
MKNPPRVYFSFRSPYSWIAMRLLAERLGGACADLEFLPFWEPDERTRVILQNMGGEVLYAPMSRAKHLYILQDIKRIAGEFNHRMAWPVDQREPWWELSHLGYLFACARGRGAEFFWGIYAARWERGQDISSTSTIREVAEGAGLDPDEIISAPEVGSLREAGARALYRSYIDGVFGVPFFIVDHSKFWGLDRLEFFLSALGERSSPGHDAGGQVATTSGCSGRFGIGVAPRASSVSQRNFCHDLDGHESAGQRDIPRELIDQLGAYDSDTAGGCG